MKKDSLNFYGLYSLLRKEIWRYLKVFNQTIIAPIINSLLFLAIFTLAFGERAIESTSLSYATFITPGLIAMTLIQNAFANSSSSLCTSKVLGHISDVIIPPISAMEYTLATTIAASSRGILVAIATAIAIRFFVDYQINNYLLLAYYLLISSLLLATIGTLCGILSNSFDQMSALTSYIITPLSFLSGTFYSVSVLPEFWYNVTVYNPFFYIIDGMRYAVTGYHDGDLIFGAIYLLVCFVCIFIITLYLFNKGYRIKN
ncbi:MAG: ABC transporter permease [Rickettsiales bacterium]|jgi:ABC-2 type transport system permease protein|nr:ABC transporter permease [Rickettsiales bacterium]